MRPHLEALFTTACKRLRWSAVVKPHQVGQQYIKREITVAWKTSVVETISMPCDFINLMA